MIKTIIATGDYFFIIHRGHIPLMTKKILRKALNFLLSSFVQSNAAAMLFAAAHFYRVATDSSAAKGAVGNVEMA
jgi:hypothetical protein